MPDYILHERLKAHPDSHTVETYLQTSGYTALRKAFRDMTPAQVHDEVKASGLLGRGGADFATGVKWGFIPAGLKPRYLVVNADEGEPCTFKDHELMVRDPHQLIEGVLLACYAMEAEKAFIYCRGELRLAHERLARAIAEASERGYIGEDILGSGASIEIVLHRGAGAYICGEETALLSSLEGYRGEPRLRPPYPAVSGAWEKPTVVNNVETIANLPWIVANGGAAYAALGTEKSKGMRIFCLSGCVNRPGNYEVELGTTFRTLIDDYGGGIRNGGEVKFIIPGGASSPWYGPDRLDMPLDMAEVKANGSMLGSGAIMVADQTISSVRSAYNIVRFFEHESCGQCTPCREGCGWLSKVLARILAGDGRPSDLGLIEDVCDSIAPGWRWGMWPYNMTTICFLGPSAAVAVISALTLFRTEFEELVSYRVAVQIGGSGGSSRARPSSSLSSSALPGAELRTPESGRAGA